MIRPPIRRLASSPLRPLLVLVACLSGPAGSETAKAPRALLGGTFIQLLDVHAEWTAEEWEQLFVDLRRLGLSRLVVQWTVYEDTAFYPSSLYKRPRRPPLDRILALADRAGIGVLVGLVHDPGYWQAVARDRDTPLVAVYLRRLRLRSEAAARELAPLVSGHASFDGFYISQEIDDLNWTSPERRALVRDFLRELAAALHGQAPGSTVALSGFTGGHMDPQALEAFWSDLLGAAGVDLVLLQDGIGALKLDLESLDLYLPAMRRATTASNKKLAVVVEVFTQVGGWPVSDGAFKAVPAPLARVVQQIDKAAAHASAGVFAFSVPEYMTPRAGAEARRLFDGYLAVLEAGDEPPPPAKTPRGAVR